MTLADNLIAYWKLDEASGNATDVHGGNDLTDTNTVTSGTGKLNGARQFTAANSEYFRKDSNASLQTGDIDFTFTCWVKFDSFGTVRRILSKFGNSAAAPNVNEYVLSYDNTANRFQFAVCESTGAIKVAQADNFGPPSTGVFYFLASQYDHTNDVSSISVNNGTPNQTTSVAGPAATNAGFNIGCLFSAVDTSPIQFMDGLIDEVGFWKRLLTGDELTQLYNSGNGLAYPLSVLPKVLRRRMGS